MRPGDVDPVPPERWDQPAQRKPGAGCAGWVVVAVGVVLLVLAAAPGSQEVETYTAGPQRVLGLVGIVLVVLGLVIRRLPKPR